jgi:biotin carboxyl carrier protein
MNNNVFRKVSVERLSSPEQLDTLMKVTSPKGWLALIALGVLLISTIVWGFFGNMETKIQSQGVLIRPGGLQSIYVTSSGAISDIRVVENDFVQKGDVVARIEQPLLLDQIKQTVDQIDNTTSKYKSNKTVELEGQLRNLQASLLRLQADYAFSSQVVSPYSGRVLEIMAKKGSSLSQGMPLINVEVGEENGRDLVAVMYIPVQEGKKVIPGMKLTIAPSSVNKEESGLLIARVTSVSEFPTNAQGMMLTLGNEGLVTQLAGKDSAMVEIHADLIQDIHTVSGYKWSTGKGPSVQMNSGTLVSGAITIEQQKPISTIIPQIK